MDPIRKVAECEGSTSRGLHKCRELRGPAEHFPPQSKHCPPPRRDNPNLLPATRDAKAVRRRSSDVSTLPAPGGGRDQLYRKSASPVSHSVERGRGPRNRAPFTAAEAVGTPGGNAALPPLIKYGPGPADRTPPAAALRVESTRISRRHVGCGQSLRRAWDGPSALAIASPLRSRQFKKHILTWLTWELTSECSPSSFSECCLSWKDVQPQIVPEAPTLCKPPVPIVSNLIPEVPGGTSPHCL
ncbi:uncharacterized protein LOC129151300 [Eptesicus fuscus]|uniref:uncharacterized protein LOC129151300 n=1 Tax=Eptesicus fuscus TaxID=29078 RepID=UPI002403CA40|nr:uncharacterized protein LOC129151300 [Eptesicus fuscus]